MTTLRSGFTTGTCAAAAAKAATLLLCDDVTSIGVEVLLPDGSREILPILFCYRDGDACEAAVCKDAGDDPDVTHKANIVARVEFCEGDDVRFAAGDGVGTVTKPGLALAVGEPAINPVPRQMIRDAVRSVTERAVRVTISVPGGQELAARTFNPRLGIVGGISIIGTSGRVRPFSAPALRDALKCSLDVAAAAGVRDPVLVPGNIGERATRRHFRVTEEQVVQVSNEWGFMLEQTQHYDFERLLIVGHPGKLAKLSEGHWDTHSSNSPSAVPTVKRVAATVLPDASFDSETVEGIFEALPTEKQKVLANALASRVRNCMESRLGSNKPLAVVLINLPGEILGSDGDLKPWT